MLPQFQTDLSGKIVTVFGGTGFLGRYIVAELAKKGALVKVATRHTPSAYFLRPYGNVGQIAPVFCAYRDQADIERIIAGSYAVVNCLGILFESGKASRFAHVHSDIPKWIAKACATQHIYRLIHISSLGVETSSSKYARTKLIGERAVQEHFPPATILRPSVIFGAEDNFMRRFAGLARILPFLPLIGGGKTRFQPVYVLDVAKAVVQALCDIRSCGHIYELGGPEILSFKEIYERLFSYLGFARPLVSMPWFMAYIKAFFLGLLPNPMLTPDQVTSLKTDNIVGEKHYHLSDLGISATPLNDVMPQFITPCQTQ